jgi:hypothetical protein
MANMDPKHYPITSPGSVSVCNTMLVSWISQSCSAINAWDAAKRYRNAVMGILLVPLAEILVTPLQLALDSRGVNFPSSIIVMALCTAAMLSIEFLHHGTGSFYEIHLKGPVG